MIKNILKILRKQTIIRPFSSSVTFCSIRRPLILGIESSCDDTGSAIMDRSGKIYGQTLHSQQDIHLRYGGILPPVAQNLHRQNIEQNIADTFNQANMKMDDIDAIAVTNRPGLSLSLLVGVRYAKYLSRKYSKPIIPIHHMQAHALTARAEHSIDYPFLCLLASGGHCLLTFVSSATEFKILGEAIDDAPGECLDKIARELQLRNLPQFAQQSGGAAIELAARTSTQPNRYEFPLPLMRERNCQFSFSGLKTSGHRLIGQLRDEEKLAPDQIIRHYEDFSAGYLRTITKHIVHRTQRAMQFCDRIDLWNGLDGRRFVFAGGVACNDFIYSALGQLCEQLDYEIYRPTKKLCTDNGIMIAWNGVERWLADEEKYLNLNIDDICVESKEAIGISLVDELAAANVACKWAKIPIMIDNTRHKTSGESAVTA